MHLKNTHEYMYIYGLSIICAFKTAILVKKKSIVLRYSFPRVGPEADPGVQAFSLQVSFKLIPRRLAVITLRQVTFPAEERHRPFTSTKYRQDRTAVRWLKSQLCRDEWQVSGTPARSRHCRCLQPCSSARR